MLFLVGSGTIPVRTETVVRADDLVNLVPGLRLDRAARMVEFDAEVVFEQREVRSADGEVLYVFGDWLELVVCSRRSREHESLLVTDVRPSAIHAGLLMLGLEPGRPSGLVSDPEDESAVVVARAEGPELVVTVVLERDGVEVEEPVGRWVRVKATGEDLEGATWLFSGSKMVEIPAELTEDGVGVERYLADLSGSILTLVNFRDDLMVRSTEVTSGDDGQALGGFVERIPEVGTRVRVRVRPKVDGGEDVEGGLDVAEP